MRLAARIACSALFSLPAMGIAQESLLGTYNASYTVTGIQSTLISVTIVISSIDNGVIKGKGVRHDRSCRGEYPLEGTLKENQIRLRAPAKGGPAGDCGFGFAGTVEGNSLVGKYGTQDLKFIK